jgi:hypothetical protein
MTLEQTLAMLKERRALEMMVAILAQSHFQAAEWHYVRLAMTDRLKWSQYLLTLADPATLAAASELLRAEILHDAPSDPSRPAPLVAADLPGSARVH